MTDYTASLESQNEELRQSLAKSQFQNERLSSYIEHLKDQHRIQSDGIKHIVQSLHAYQYDPQRTAHIIAELCRVVGIETKPNWIPPQLLMSHPITLPSYNY